MEFGDYVGFSAADYNVLSENATIMDFLQGKITQVTIEGNSFYVFTGDEVELLELLEGFDDIVVELTYFSYQKSVWSVVGF